MIAALLAWPALALLAAGTPRQATALFDGAAGHGTRRALRLAGLVLLGGSLAMVLAGGDRGRQVMTWVGLVGMEALAVGLLCSVAAGLKARAARTLTPPYRRAARREGPPRPQPVALAELGTASRR